jgi:type VI secretion system secreted protein Hcp
MKVLTTVFCLVALPMVVVAQQGPPAQANSPLAKSTITVSIPGMNCTTAAGTGNFNVLSYSWGASNPSTIGIPGGGTGAGKVSISSLNVMKQFDACSPVLFESVSKGTFFKMLTLTQRSPDGEAVSTVALENVVVESWQVSSSTSQLSATESVSFAAQKFCVTDVPSGNKFCYDVALQKVL